MVHHLVSWLEAKDPFVEFFASCHDGYCLSPAKLVLLSFLWHWLLFFWSHPLSLLLTRSYKTLGAGMQAEWNSRVVSNIHALITAQGAARAMLWDPVYHATDYAFGMSDLMQFYLAFSTGYFLYDFFIIHIHASTGLWDAATFLHHVIAIICNIAVLMSGEAEYFLGFFLFTEATTPFINQRWFCSVTNMRESTLYLVNGLLMFLGWMVVRVGIMSYIMWLIISERQTGFSKMTLTMQAVAFPSLALAWLLNMYWGYLIGKGFMKAVLGAGGSAPAKKPPAAKAATVRSPQRGEGGQRKKRNE